MGRGPRRVDGPPTWIDAAWIGRIDSMPPLPWCTIRSSRVCSRKSRDQAGPGRTADTVLGDTLRRYGLDARVLHSTSWRHDGDHVVLTYLAVVDPPSTLNPNLTSEPAARVDLARGDATAAPAAIETSQVLEHALRHLCWLVADDPAVATALPEWRGALEPYVPEPFRQL